MFRLKNGDVILFQGDSITDGNRGRNQDLNHIHGHGYQYILASEMEADNLDKSIVIHNRGISGNCIADLHARWDEDCLNLRPTILSILVGVNDAHFNFYDETGSSPERYEETFRTLLDDAIKINPDITIVIMEPFFGESKTAGYNEYMKAHVPEFAASAKKIADEYNAIFVPLQDIFDEQIKTADTFRLLWDGVHPTTGAHQLIARRWKDCVEEKINSR